MPERPIEDRGAAPRNFWRPRGGAAAAAPPARRPFWCTRVARQVQCSWWPLILLTSHCSLTMPRSQTASAHPLPLTPTRRCARTPTAARGWRRAWRSQRRCQRSSRPARGAVPALLPPLGVARGQANDAVGVARSGPCGNVKGVQRGVRRQHPPGQRGHAACTWEGQAGMGGGSEVGTSRALTQRLGTPTSAPQRDATISAAHGGQQVNEEVQAPPLECLERVVGTHSQQHLSALRRVGGRQLGAGEGNGRGCRRLAGRARQHWEGLEATTRADLGVDEQKGEFQGDHQQLWHWQAPAACGASLQRHPGHVCRNFLRQGLDVQGFQRGHVCKRRQLDGIVLSVPTRNTMG